MKGFAPALVVAGWLAALAGGAPGSAETSLEQRLRTHEVVQAALRGDTEAVMAGLDAGVPVDATLPPRDPRYPYTERTALEAAAIYARLDLVRALLDRGAVLRRDERHGIYAASMHTLESPELLELLHTHAGPDLSLDADFGPALVRAAANGAASEVDFLLGIGVDPDWRGRHEPWDDPAIVRAAHHFEVVDRLLAAGADPTGGSLPYRWSPLFAAASASDPDRTRQFLDLGVDPHMTGPNGNALSIAACITPRTVRPTATARGRTNQVVGLLLDQGVDPNVRYEGRTPLRCAEDNHDAELAAALEAAGGRSRESVWNQLRRGVAVAGLSIALLLGGGM